ncbi:MAG: tRNA (adenosine(37)-N6)-threonylcarbamoyltransferase complex ATPase subunit type 1 TsaE [Deltaproteobacteria bacterium]|nr:tRNA (adenosine(37)-N6)-threonylcarbamoyltransferase complex ATPase subunit type 1 TsaE [Deltaproteobacteria bacterium]
MEIPLPTRRATIRLARSLAPGLRVGDLLVLSGPLGSGKTFFVRALCRALGVPESVPVTSPSFTLVRPYAEGRIPIVHADLYRIGASEEVDMLGLRALRAEALVLVEWGRPYAAQLGGEAISVELDTAEGRRRARLDGDDAGRARLVRLVRPSSFFLPA